VVSAAKIPMSGAINGWLLFLAAHGIVMVRLLDCPQSCRLTVGVIPLDPTDLDNPSYRDDVGRWRWVDDDGGDGARATGAR